MEFEAQSRQVMYPIRLGTGAGYVNLRRKTWKQRRVGHEEEGFSSNRLESAVFVLSLRDTPVITPMLYFCDNQVLLNAVSRRVGEGDQATLVGSPDVDIFTGGDRSAPEKNTSEHGDVLG